MKCFARCALMLLIIFVGSAMVLGTCAWFAASWLNEGDMPVKADRILILSGDPLRSIYAAELYRDGIAKKIYLTRSVRPPRFRIYEDLGILLPRFEDLSRAILLKKGVNDRDIHLIDSRPLLSTAEEAHVSGEFFRQSGAGSLLIVTSPYHVRRARMIFHAAMPDISISVVATPYDRIPEKWWTDQAAARLVVLEYTKMAYYVFGGRFTSNNAGQLP